MIFVECFSSQPHTHHVDVHPSKLRHYKNYLHELNYKGLIFPLAVRDVHTFEKLNPYLKINVLSFDDDEKDFLPLYVSKNITASTHINLLLISDGNLGRRFITP